MSEDTAGPPTSSSTETVAHHYLPILAAAGTGILVGSAMVATRYVIGQTGPASLALMRYAIGFCCLLPAVLAGPRPRFAARDLAPIALLGIVQFGILVALLNFGLQFISAALGALLFSTMPLLTMVLGAALGRERLTLAKTIGISFTVVGVGLALHPAALLAGGSSSWIGPLAVLGSALCGAVCSVLYRPYVRRYPTSAVSALAMLASVGFLALLAVGEGFFDAWPHFTPTGWAAVIFIGVNSGAGYFLWLWALNHTTPTRVTAFLALGPITATLLGGLLLSERVGLAALAGLACVVCGLWLAHRQLDRG